MHKDSVPVFPQGVISQYQNSKHSFDISLLDNVEVGQPLNGVLTTQIASTRNENILDFEIFKDIKEFILESVRHHLETVEMFAYDDIWLTSSWVNFCEPGGFQDFHNHANSILSGCYYLQADDSQPGLTFKKIQIDSHPFFSTYTTVNLPHKATKIELKVRTGSLIVFPSFMVHGHETNNTSKTRIGLAFNVLINQPEDKAPAGWYHIKFAR
jgi:uncharacterized protein (TIGR02466 family)